MNARSVKTVNSKVNKLADLQTLVSLTDCDTLCITETWLKEWQMQTFYQIVLTYSDVIVIMGRQVGGILLAEKQNITANVIDDTEINCEIILIEIQPL